MTSTSVERSRTRARRLLLSLSTILCSGLAMPAFAQAVSPHPNPDANGVDLTDGTFNLQLPIASVGSGDAALPIVALGGQIDNWSSITFNRTVSGTVTHFQVALGTRFDNFTSASAQSTVGSRAVLTVGDDSASYRMADGTVIEFGNPWGTAGGTSNLCDVNNNNGCFLLPLAITDKGGTTTSFDWLLHGNCDGPFGEANCTFSWRLADVSNNAGSQIDWTYATNSVLLHHNPGPTWFQRTSAVLSGGGTAVGTVAYASPSAGVFTITTPGGRTWQITGTGVTAVRRPGATSDTMTVSYSGSKVSSVTRDGVTTNYSYSVSGTTATMVVTDALSHSKTIVSDLNVRRPTSVTDANGKTTTYAYNSFGEVTETAFPEGNKVQYTYDSRGNVTETRLKAKSGSGLADVVTTASYDSTCTSPLSCNSPNWTRDALGNQTDYTYDATSGLVASVTLPAPATGANRPQTRYSYTGNLLTGVSTCQTGVAPACVGTADEVKTVITYGAGRTVTSIAKGTGNGSLTATTTATYSAAGDLLTVDGPLSGSADTTTYRYDADRLRVGVISADPDGAGALKRRAVKRTYNSAGQPTVTEVGTVNGTTDTDWSAFVSLQQSTATYDANARKILDTVTASASTYNVTQYSYDADGRPECTALRMNSAAWGSLPSSACTLGTTGSYGADRITKTIYDAAGQVTKTQTAYGVAGVQADETTGTYNDNGTLATLTDAEGNKTTYVYDGFDRLLQAFYPSTTTGAGTSSGSDYTQLTYDAGSEVIARRLRDGNSIGYSYDHLGRLTAKDLPGSESDVAYSYDLLGRPIVAATTAQTLTFGYDALGRATSQSGPLGTVVTQYDLAGRRTSLTWPDSFYVSYDYLVTGEVTAIRENGASSGVGVLATYAYDDLGRRTSLTRGNGTSSNFGYDSASRLTLLGLDLDGAGTTNDLGLGFSYSPANQITGTTRSNDGYAWGGAANRNDASSVNGLNQVTTVGTGSVGYDSKGNLNSTGSNSYGYSSENLLLTGPSSASLVYDPLLRLYQEGGSSVATRLFQYDGQAMIGEYDTSAVMQRRYVAGPGSDEPLVEYDKSGGGYTRVWLHADERGSIVAQSNDSGVTTAMNSYDEYGVPASNNTGRFGYTGQGWLPSFDVWYYKARMYAPRLGRFMQTDPIGYSDGLNWYNYVNGDPVNSIDPLGLEDVTVNGSYGCASDEHHVKNVGCVSNGHGFILRAPATSTGDGGGGGGGGDQGTVGDEVVVTGVRQKKDKPSTLENIWACTKDQYGFGDDDNAGDAAAGVGRGASEVLAAPVPKVAAGFYRHPGSSAVTNVLNALSVRTRIGSRVFFSGSAARISSVLFRSARVATVLGRVNVITGALFTAYDVGSIALCTYGKSK